MFPNPVAEADVELDTTGGPIAGVAGEYTIEAPTGRLGLVFQNVPDPSGKCCHVVAWLRPTSSMAGQIEVGDVISYINAVATSHLDHTMISKNLLDADTAGERRLLVIKRGAITGSDGKGWAPAT